MNDKQRAKQLAALFDRDHQHLLSMLGDVQYLCGKGSYLPAAKVFGELRRVLEHHLFEEDSAMADLVRDGGCPDELARRIASDHALLKQLLERTAQAVSRNDDAEFVKCARDLGRAVAAHERTEREELLRALCERLHDPAKVESIVHRLVDR